MYIKLVLLVLGTGTVENSYNSSSTIDYTIIIGKDYKGE